MPDQQDIRVERDGATGVVTLDRPGKLNAMTRGMAGRLVDQIDRLDRDDDVRALVITGAGRVFCAGADLTDEGSSLTSAGQPARPESFDWANPDMRDFGGVIALRLFDCNKPVIVAFNGPAAGVGVTMTLAADSRIAARTAKFVLPFTRRGIVPESASSWFLPRLVGITTALDWTLRGTSVPADEALSCGLVNALHDPADLRSAACAMAREIADNSSPVSVALTRRMMWKGLAMNDPRAAHRMESEILFHRSKAADVREGVASFLEKRPPEFPDRITGRMPDFDHF